MAITVDLRSILAAARHSSSMALTLQPPRGTSIAPEVLAAAVTVADRAVVEDPDTPYGGYPPVRGGGAWQGSHGPVAEVVAFETPADLERWLEVLTSALERAGCSGRIGLERMQSPEIFDDPAKALTAVLCASGWGVDDESGRAFPIWRRDPNAPHDLPSAIVEWVASSGWPCYLRTSESSYLVPVERLFERVCDAASSPWVVVSATPDVDHLRQALFDRSGRVILHHRDVDLGWAEELAELRSVILQWGEWCEYAMVRRSSTTALMTADVIGHLPPGFPPGSRTLTYYQFERGQDRVQVPDAHGLQLLTDEHLARFPGTDRWVLTPAGEGRTLVEASDPSAWFANDQPADEVLEPARRDFHDLIMKKGPPSRSGRQTPPSSPPTVP